MWSLVNASYGIAMGQRPRDPEETHHYRGHLPERSALLGPDARLAAAQERRRDHLLQAAREQWVDEVDGEDRPSRANRASPGWTQVFGLRLQLAARGAWPHLVRELGHQSRRKAGLLEHLRRLSS